MHINVISENKKAFDNFQFGPLYVKEASKSAVSINKTNITCINIHIEKAEQFM